MNVVGEELYYRAALQPKLRGVFGKWDWVASGVGFALNHLYYWWRVPFLVPAGLGFAFIIGPIGSLPLSILSHWIANELFLFLLEIPVLLGFGQFVPNAFGKREKKCLKNEKHTGSVVLACPEMAKAAKGEGVNSLSEESLALLGEASETIFNINQGKTKNCSGVTVIMADFISTTHRPTLCPLFVEKRHEAIGDCV